MEKTGVQKLSGVLKILVIIAFICNLLILPLVPGLVVIGSEGGLDTLLRLEADIPLPLFFLAVCWQALPRVWLTPYTAMLAGFLLFCGINTAVCLWQGRRVLGTVTVGSPFQRANGRSMKIMALCCALISGAALIRTVWGLFYYRSLRSLFTYNALFVPLFAVGCLLCLVIATLFGQAAELKEDSDLTI